MPFDIHTTAEEAAQAFKDQITGKNIVIVGATVKSLGAEFLRVVAPYAGTVWIAGRSKERLQYAIDEAVKSLDSPKPDIRIVEMDVTSFESVRTGAAAISAAKLPIHVIVPSVMVSEDKTTSHTTDGFETHLQAYHLSSFLLYSLLLPQLRQAGPGARVITISSIAHHLQPFRWDDPNYKLRPEEYDSGAAYAQAKLANILFIRELAKRAGPEGPLAFTLHPGNVLTNGGSKGTATFIKYGILHPDGTPNPDSPYPIKSIEAATATYVVAAFDPALVDQNGAYLIDCQVQNDKLAPTVTDEDALRLWNMTEEMNGIKFM